MRSLDIAAKEWKCGCGVRWHQCKHHLAVPSVLRSRKSAGKLSQRKVTVQSQEFLEKRLAELDGLKPHKRDKMQKDTQEAHTGENNAAILWSVQKVCSKGTKLKRKFRHLSDSGGCDGDL